MFASPSLFCLPPPLAPFSITSGSACKREPTRKHMWTCMRGVCVCVSLVSLSCLCLYVPGYVGPPAEPSLASLSAPPATSIPNRQGRANVRACICPLRLSHLRVARSDVLCVAASTELHGMRERIRRADQILLLGGQSPLHPLLQLLQNDKARSNLGCLHKTEL